MITFNPATHVELDPARRPKALVWTEEPIAGEGLYALFHLVALRGLRRGEACGLRWEDVDLPGRTVTVATQLVETGGEVEETAPKSDAGNRVVALDAETVAVLKLHRARQGKARLAAGESWIERGRVFTRATGAWLEPTWLSNHLDRLVLRTGLPPIRLHDLRHGAAIIALAAGADMKVVQEMLGHSSFALTADTYTSVLPEVAHAAAEAAARLVPRRKGKRTAGLTPGSEGPTAPAKPGGSSRRSKAKRQVNAAS